MALLARGTLHWVLAPALAGLLLLLVPGNVGHAAGLLLLLLAALLANFFRDPERVPPASPTLVSPADGVVTEVREAEDGGTVVVVFMNIHNVHVNRAPCDGNVVRRVHQPGSHMPAWKKESDRNERLTWDLDTPHGPVRVVQIAGLLARRIVPYVAEGRPVRRGERLGIIRLGSRVDTYLPEGVRVAVNVGDVVHAGTSVLAWPAKGA